MSQDTHFVRASHLRSVQVSEHLTVAYRGQFAYFLHCPEISLSNLTFEIEGHNWTGNSTAEISKESLSESFL